MILWVETVLPWSDQWTSSSWRPLSAAACPPTLPTTQSPRTASPGSPGCEPVGWRVYLKWQPLNQDNQLICTIFLHLPDRFCSWWSRRRGSSADSEIFSSRKGGDEIRDLRPMIRQSSLKGTKVAWIEYTYKETFFINRYHACSENVILSEWLVGEKLICGVCKNISATILPCSIVRPRVDDNFVAALGD